MAHLASTRKRVIETLYREALELADEVRAVFDLSEIEARRKGPDDPYRVSLSCEALRATTRMMHGLAWLLNQRAFLRGELSEAQLRRTGGLSSVAEQERDRIAMLGEGLQAMIVRTEDFYARLLRLEAEWQRIDDAKAPAVARMQDRIAREFAKAG